MRCNCLFSPGEEPTRREGSLEIISMDSSSLGQGSSWDSRGAGTTSGVGVKGFASVVAYLRDEL
jgi:hypothetical protein